MSRCLLHSEKEERREIVAEFLIQRGPGGREAAGADQRRGPGLSGPAAGGREADPGAWPHLRVITCHMSVMSIMLTRLGGVISKDGDNEKCEDKWRHNDVCMENPDRNYGSSG